MNYTEYIKPELLIFIPVLIVMGKMFKDSPLNDKHIPLILGILSVISSWGYLLAFIVMFGYSVPQALITGFIQGILIAGMAVYGNQIFKQYTKKDE